jgi:hypothetical protein
MVEAATSETLGFLAKLVRQSLTETEEFWKVEEQQSKFLSLLDVTREFVPSLISFADDDIACNSKRNSTSMSTSAGEA